ncbi:MAG: putative exported protein [Cenarchaeum symbiont of Oopsacas minuta]|nr:putative exported protein [Cenarchaeum symbiont of Oopsacas minuta]
MNTKYPLVIVLVLFTLIGTFEAVIGQTEDAKNLSLLLEPVIVQWFDFNRISLDAQITELSNVHKTSWQVTIDNNLRYGNPNGNAVIRLYDENVENKFIEVGMGAPPNDKLWVAVKIPGAEEYVIVHSKLERGWVPDAKTIISYTDRAGMTINNGARIIISNLDIDLFAINAYSVHGMEGSTDPIATVSGEYIIEFLSGDPAGNVFHLFPFYVTAAIGALVGILFITKKKPTRSHKS